MEGAISEKKQVYSHSKLWLFENCPEAYKIKYIDKTFPDLPGNIHAFLGDLTHQSLEWLYNEKLSDRQVSPEQLVEHFTDNWVNQFSQELRISGDQEEYFIKGIKFLVNYYQKNFPFSEPTLETEKQITFSLDKEGKYKITGYIDRIVKISEEKYEVHDYKTNAAMKTQEQVDSDRQLAFYHLGLRELFGQDIQVKLVWHFLAHNKSIESSRTQEELEKLKQDTIDLIKKIESTSEWPACGKKFCDWCSYKQANLGQTKLAT